MPEAGHHRLRKGGEKLTESSVEEHQSSSALGNGWTGSSGPHQANTRLSGCVWIGHRRSRDS
ncbi:hypothetical protein PCANC_03254 [Puccinia coronata f. sp. avenae]|uniref:Uncharacterized protein n=1 Tax=Puccinia coronata f. sp. avenae TaxID=200324 RepID=A0A2N5VYV4_9BASI|nr:hypothetical protein PCANC_02895 [Puccinia coronata f. sp. avenae]PLW31916.1 hypothetical protein PCASD_21250 [Puccinia coronata f. sp. avenae]PLW55181.1 hypothetical protein PCANC_03254 [Puccinia coronata f. sp. avenae]